MPSAQTLYFQQALNPIFESLETTQGQPFLVGPYGPGLALVLTLGIQRFDEAVRRPKQLNQKSHGRSWLMVTPTPEAAEQLYRDLQFFHALFDIDPSHLAFFPHRGNMPYECVHPPIELVADRMQTLLRLTRSHPTIVVTPIQALLQRLIPTRLFSEYSVSLKVGTVVEREEFTANLLRLGYRRVSVVEAPGEFCVRGGILDVFSLAYANPLRLELLGDTIESARLFDPTTQESIDKQSTVWILPARDYLPPPQQMAQPAIDFPPDAEWQLPDVYSEMALLADYFAESPFVVTVDPLSLEKQATDWWDTLMDTWDKKTLDTPNSQVFPPDGLYADWGEIQKKIEHWPTLATDSLAPLNSSCHPVVHLPIQTPASAGLGVRGMTFSDCLGILERLRENGMVLILARNQGQAGRLLALFSEHNCSAVAWNPQNWKISHQGRAPFYILQGDLSSGLVFKEAGFSIITEEELFAKAARHRPPPKTKMATFLSSLDELSEGDLVVHIQHGISRYQGLRHLSVQGFESDFLVLQFAGHDTLYVPLDRLNLVQRYRGSDNHVPKLDRLGGTSWAKTTARVKKGIEDMTQELLELYANRVVVERKGYHSDVTLTHEFEAAFEYDETPDQTRTIQDIEKDLESPKPMDRLVCGDVGYGKTEVAMRAAFHAVQNNRQVGVLVPTTLLAQQHFETFTRRFAPFPVRVEVLSRFQTSKEVKSLLHDLSRGTIDIMIGTHRLLQKNVQFKNLGLVIIDEEQWFGVRHKERLKQLRTQVDVLTLTATPIPRTLQMAFSGVRDLSVIDTPPPGRLAIQTHVLRFDPKIIHDAIRRELARGGQVFFVHNRVQSIERMGSWIQDLVPDARVVIAHGQLDERLLESVIMKFFHGEADVLVASAIIQSGLDLPRANTILVDRADTFGLAQLYQLRGRVGRAGDQAYAYFFFPNEEVLTSDAQKRLMAIQEFVELGSGFRIAAADLEIRGSGNLLGKQQSGNISAVGLDLYMKMLEQAVQECKGEGVKEELDPMLHLNISAFIPEDYVEDGHQRLSLYKRLSGSQQMGDLALLHGETQDRYGSLPEPVERLFEVMQIKLLAKFVGLEAVGVKGRVISLTFDKKGTIPEGGVHWLMDYAKERIQFLAPYACEIQAKHETWSQVCQELNHLLTELREYANETVKVS